MVDCCSDCNRLLGVDQFFSREAKRYARRFRKKGLDKVQRYIVEGIVGSHPVFKRVVDIGCGTGNLLLTLYTYGFERAIGIDISKGMIEHARELTRELHRDDRIEYIQGDFIECAESIDTVDITILDKVVCCYEDIYTLLHKALAKTNSIIAISHPRNKFSNKLVVQLQIFLASIFKWSFHPYWHDWDKIVSQIQDYGFVPVYSRRTFIWDVIVFRRE